MKKLLIILTLFLVSCSEEIKNIEEPKEENNISVNNEITLPDFDEENFLNSEENKQNKQKAAECMAKITGKDFSWKGIIQAFEYDGECYYLAFDTIDYYDEKFASNLYTTSKNGEEIYNVIYSEGWDGYPEYIKNEKLTILKQTLDYTEERFSGICEFGGLDLEYGVNVFNTLDNIYLKNNIVPPRIIYTKEDFKEPYFLLLTGNYKKEEWEDYLKYNEEYLEEFKNYLNNYYKIKNSSYYEDLKETFTKTENFLLDIFLKDIGTKYCYFHGFKNHWDSSMDYSQFFVYLNNLKIEDLIYAKEKLDILLNYKKEVPAEILEKCPIEEGLKFYFFKDDVCYVFGVMFDYIQSDHFEDRFFVYSSEDYVVAMNSQEKYYQDSIFKNGEHGYAVNSYLNDLSYFKNRYKPIFFKDFEEKQEINVDIVNTLARTLKSIGIDELPEDYQMINYIEGFTQETFDEHNTKNKKYIKEELKLDVDLTKVENLKLKNLYEDIKKELKNIK